MSQTLHWLKSNKQALQCKLSTKWKQDPKCYCHILKPFTSGKTPSFLTNPSSVINIFAPRVIPREHTSWHNSLSNGQFTCRKMGKEEKSSTSHKKRGKPSFCDWSWCFTKPQHRQDDSTSREPIQKIVHSFVNMQCICYFVVYTHLSLMAKSD